jgi:hypothetical protein
MAGGKKLNIKDVEGLVKQSQDLDSRFDKGSIQKSFL